MNFRNARLNAFGIIDCEIEHPQFGWIPFTANPDDVEPLGRTIFDAAKDTAAPYVAPPRPDPAEALAAWREAADMDKGEFCIGLMRLGVLPKSEAKAAAKGEWPATFAAALSKMPKGFDADESEIVWAATTRVRRMHPLLQMLIPLSKLTEAQVDAMFGWQG